MAKQLLLLLGGLALAGSAAAQGLWAAPGATWTYSYGLFDASGDMTMTYVGTATISGQTAMRFSRNLYTKSWLMPGQPPQYQFLPELVLRADADRLYVLADDQQYYMLFNFAAQVGDSWLTPAAQPRNVCANTQVRLLVDSVGVATVQGTSRRWLRLRMQSLAGQQPSVNYAWGGRIYEGLGPTTSYILPTGIINCGGTDPGSIGGLLCYRATGQSTFYGSTAQRCSAIVTATAEQRAEQQRFDVYPNPSQGELHLRLPAVLGPEASLELHDLTGRCLLRTAVPTSGKLDVRHLPKGLYALSLRQPGTTPATHRIVLQ